MDVKPTYRIIVANSEGPELPPYVFIPEKGSTEWMRDLSHATGCFYQLKGYSYVRKVNPNWPNSKDPCSEQMYYEVTVHFQPVAAGSYYLMEYKRTWWQWFTQLLFGPTEIL